MKNQKQISIGLFILLSFSCVSAVGVLQSTEKVGSTGIIIRTEKQSPIIVTSPLSLPPPPEPVVDVDIFSDIGCTKQLMTIDWGELEAGESSSKSIYIKNNGETRIVLRLYTENWSSQVADDHISLTWDYNGSLLKSGQIFNVNLILEIDSDCPELIQYRFDIIIIGS